jgi:hypothetical protein
MPSLSLFISRRSSSKQPVSAKYVPDGPCPRLDFWICGGRDDLVKRILPHLTRSFREEQYFESVVGQKPWAAEFIRSESVGDEEEVVGDLDTDGRSYSMSKAAFDVSPQRMVDDLILIARSWFLMLLRYTFRARCGSDMRQTPAPLELRDLRGDFGSRIDERTLIRRPSLYAEYKEIYKETKQRLGWTYFCSGFGSFCRSIGLETSSTKLEGMYEDLQRSLPQILLKRLEDMKRKTTSLQDELELHRLDESLKACRELMEKLLPDRPEEKKGKGTWKPRGQEYGRRWRELFSKEWARCKEQRPIGHPLRQLIHEHKYFTVGQNLYGTLSERIHNHQQYRTQELSSDVTDVIFSILPPDWEIRRLWDLETEKRRWGLI